MNKLFSHFSLFLPKDIVSGDFYWHTGIEEGDSRRDYIAVVDCTGHGVPGAFMSMIGSRLLNSIVNEQEIYDPAKILDRLDKSVQKALRQHQTENRDGMEVCLIRIDTTPTQRSLYFSGARRPIYLYKSETKELLKYVGSARGIAGPRIKSKLLEFETSLIDVKPNDVVYLTTDGYKDQNDMERKRLGSQAIMRAFQSIGHMPMETQCLKIQHMLEEHMNGVEQRDDITIFGVRI
jgi:serine phosphatase RsbU (regulator of sigma subunit)